MAKSYTVFKRSIPAGAKDSYSVSGAFDPDTPDWDRRWQLIASKVSLKLARTVAREAIETPDFGIVQVIRHGLTPRTTGAVEAFVKVGPAAMAHRERAWLEQMRATGRESEARETLSRMSRNGRRR